MANRLPLFSHTDTPKNISMKLNHAMSLLSTSNSISKAGNSCTIQHNNLPGADGGTKKSKWHVTGLQHRAVSDWVSAGAAYWTKSGSNIYYNNGNVGIGTTTGLSELLNIGDENATTSTDRKALRFNSGGFSTPGDYLTDSNGDKIILYDNSTGFYDARMGIGTGGNFWFKSMGSSDSVGSFNFYVGNSKTNALHIAPGGSVGIRNSSPTSGATLHLGDNIDSILLMESATGDIRGIRRTGDNVWYSTDSAGANPIFKTDSSSASLGVSTLSAWGGGYKGLQNGGLSLMSNGGTGNFITSNLYYNGSWRFVGNGYGALLDFSDGGLIFHRGSSINSSGEGAGALGKFLLSVVFNRTGGITVYDSSTPTAATGRSDFYSSSGEMWVQDQSGNQTQLSPHNEDGDWEYDSKNVKTGKHIKINMEKMIRFLEKYHGKKFIEEL